MTILALLRWVLRFPLERFRAVHLDFSCDTDFKTTFEGRNRIHRRVRLRRCRLGLGSYVAPDTCLEDMVVGRFSSIGNGVRQAIGMHPSRTWATTHPAFFSPSLQAGFGFADRSLFDERRMAAGPYRVAVGNDVWIGAYSTLADGVTIGDGAIVGACSLVLRDIPPYEVWGGVPARKIRDRFDPSHRDGLLRLAWWNRDFDWIKRHSHLFGNVDILLGNLDDG